MKGSTTIYILVVALMALGIAVGGWGDDDGDEGGAAQDAGAAADPRPGAADGADRIIYATAVERGARLLGRDADIAAYDPARVVWWPPDSAAGSLQGRYPDQKLPVLIIDPNLS